MDSMDTTVTREHLAALVLTLLLIAVAAVVTRGHPSCVPGYLHDHGWHVGSPAHYCELTRSHR